MLGASHRIAAALAGAAYGTATGQPASMVLLTTLVATTAGAGPASPDLDQTETWRTLTKPLPGSLVGHRHLTHWWGLPLAAGALVGRLPAEARWVAAALIAGWVSHLVGDLVFGRLPILPWGPRTVGLGLDTGGFIETGKLGARTLLPWGPTRLLLGAALVITLAGWWPVITDRITA